MVWVPEGERKEDCQAGLTAFMDFAVRLGFICQKVKTSPPAQVQKYCGMLFDTRAAPTLRVPPNKVSRCLASIDFLLHRPRSQELSRLSLAVVTGVLQSVVEATPRRVGQAHLRSLYDDLHLLEDTCDKVGAAKYYTTVALRLTSTEALVWWQQWLRSGSGATTGANMDQGVILKFGDGSGTGTGGTREHYPLQDSHLAPHSAIESWMGVWTLKARAQSSNWKELRTIYRALQHEKTHPNRVRGCMVLYFTDNLVSYFVVNGSSSRSPGLHSLVVKIKELEQELGCHLEVVHVPGTYLIMQGTDGLSRGVWLSPQRQFVGINSAIFQPARYTVQLHTWVMDLLHLPRNQGYHIGSDLSWVPRAIRHQLTFWTPPPELARQALVTFLQAWVQSP